MTTSTSGTATNVKAWGSELLALIAEAVIERKTPLYLWVLEQNVHAQAFFEARGAARVEQARVSAPGGVASCLNGAPRILRCAWSDAAVLLEYRLPKGQATTGS